MLFTASSFAAVALLSASAVSAQSIPAAADATQLATVSAQYANSGLNETGNAGFGISLDAKALLNVILASGEQVQNGQAYSVDQVSTMPTISVTPSNETAAWFNSSSTYTLTLADASSLGDPDAEGNYRHFLANSLTGEAGSESNLTFVPEGGNVITNFAAPGPISGTGPHRYAWLMFVQPSDFQAPQNLSTEGTAPGHWYVQSYVQSTGLELVAASFFTVEVGSPTGSVASTMPVTSVSVASSSAAGASSTAHSSGASHSGSSSSGAASPSSTGAPSSGATKSVAFSLGAGLVGLVGLVSML
ncbi:hypothetical protein JCM8115_001431 [Rhodotorula mucilaginosa]|nr:hypothetical protein B0A53_01690 [Rhodotorula sp. CCFEE 5036]